MEKILYHPQREKELFVKLANELTHVEYVKLSEANKFRTQFNGNVENTKTYLSGVLSSLKRLEELLLPCALEPNEKV